MLAVYPAWPCIERYANENVYIDLVTASLPVHKAYNDEYGNQSFLKSAEHYGTQDLKGGGAACITIVQNTLKGNLHKFFSGYHALFQK